VERTGSTRSETVRIFMDSPPPHLTSPPRGKSNFGLSDTLAGKIFTAKVR
jgi:hypothetical protein